MNKFNKLENLRQHIFIDLSEKKEFKVNSSVLDILNKNKIYIDLDWIKTENDLLKLLYDKLCQIDKIKEILDSYDILKDNFWFIDFNIISDELEIAELKIVFNNIDKISLELQKILNSLISVRERKIIYILIWKLKNYRFFTWIEGINIKEGDDYIII